MKNFQQTPKARRLSMANNKAALALTKPSVFQPRDSWSNKKTVSGVPVSVLEYKQTPKSHWPSPTMLHPW